MKALAIRTAMVGGGTSYDLYIPLEEVPPHARDYWSHTIIRGGRKFMDFDYATVSAEHCAMPAGIERLWDYNAHEKRAARAGAAVLRKVFPEFTLEEMPLLWVDVGEPESAEVWTEV